MKAKGIELCLQLPRLFKMMQLDYPANQKCDFLNHCSV